MRASVIQLSRLAALGSAGGPRPPSSTNSSSNAKSYHKCLTHEFLSPIKKNFYPLQRVLFLLPFFLMIEIIIYSHLLIPLVAICFFLHDRSESDENIVGWRGGGGGRRRGSSA